MGIIKTAVKRKVTVLMVFLCITVLGLVSFRGLGLDLMPEMEMPIALVMTTYSGAGSEEVETMITKTVESAVASVEGLDTMMSISSSGMSMVMIQYGWDVDLDVASQDLREQISMIESYLPDEADKPMVMKMNMNQMPIMVVAASGGSNLADLKETMDNDIVPVLERQPGVASVQVGGGYVESIDVVVSPQTLENYNLSLNSIVGAIASNNINMAAGQVVDGGKNMTIRLIGKYKQLADVENVDVPLPTGSIVKLKDIASVNMVQSRDDAAVYLNGGDALYFAVMKQSDANTVETAEAVQAALAELSGKLPGGITFIEAMNQADMINMAIDNLVSSLLQGIVLAVIVLFLFLRSVRSTLVIAISIPVSLIATFMLMGFGGMTFNMLTLGGMALGAGMMVDSSIVILENIQRLRTDGLSAFEASVKGAKQMVLAVLSSTLTTIAIFLPIAFTEGITSVLFMDMALVISFALLTSLITAVILVPMLCSVLLRPEASYSTEGKGLKAFIGRGQDAFAKFFDAARERYAKMLAYCLRHRKRTVLVVAVMFVVSIGLVGMVGMEFMPSQASGSITVSLSLEDGTAKEQTELYAKRAEEIIVDTCGDDLENMLAIVGGSAMSMTGSSENTAEMMISIVDEKNRHWDINELGDKLRTRLSDIAGAEISVSVGDMMSISSSGMAGATMYIYGEDLDVLKELSDRVCAIMSSMPAAREVSGSLEDALPVLEVTINGSKASAMGMSVPQVASAISGYVNGVTASRFTKEDGEEINIDVMVPEAYQDDLDAILNQRMTSPSGAIYRLGDVVTVTQGLGPLSISRENQERYCSVSCSLVGQDLNSFTAELEDRIAAELVLPEGYRISNEGSYQQMMEAFGSLVLAMLLGLLLIYMIMASLYESFSQPFIIFFTLPTAFIGAFFGLFITGRALDVTGMIGLLMLIGIVVNNGIVLVDSINDFRRSEGMDMTEAIMHAAPLRLRPVLMTALTTILSMLPMAFFGSDGGQMMAGLATVVMFGLAFSTFITLLFVPVIYSLFDQLAAKLGRRKNAAGGGLRMVEDK